MAYGCVYMVVDAPPTSQYQFGDIVVLPCSEPCEDSMIDDATVVPIAETCMEYPPARQAAAGGPKPRQFFETKAGTVYRRVS